MSNAPAPSDGANSATAPTPSRRYTFVLVHGAWHDGSTWNQVSRHLRQLGHIVHTPTIAGHGKDADKHTTHADGVTSLVDYLTTRDLQDVVLVGHSFGGTFIAKAAEQTPERLRRLVFQNAFVLEDGCSVMDESPPGIRRLIRRLANGAAVLLPFAMWRELFMNDADHAQAEATYLRLSPQPIGMIETPLDLQRFYKLIEAGQLRCSYLNATDDVTMPAGPYAWHPRFSARLGPLCRIVQMPGSHEVMFTNPTALATKLIEAGRD